MENEPIITITPLAKARLDELLALLVRNEYFGFYDTAENYVQKIYDFIKSIPNQKHKAAKNTKHGEWYCRYKANKKTSWYITFDTDNVNYVVRNIINNHTEEYPIFIQILQ